jgi:hypothetical protein
MQHHSIFSFEWNLIVTKQIYLAIFSMGAYACSSLLYHFLWRQNYIDTHNPAESWNKMQLAIDGQNVLKLCPNLYLVEPDFAFARSSIIISNIVQQLKYLCRLQGYSSQEHSPCITTDTFKLISWNYVVAMERMSSNIPKVTIASCNKPRALMSKKFCILFHLLLLLGDCCIWWNESSVFHRFKCAYM